MKASDIRTGHIYYVDYEPVKIPEFNGVHLSLVMKKNNDKQTFVVMPLTSSSNGKGINKVNIGKIAALPQELKKKDTYAVFNQVRTVNASRFIAVKCSSKGSGGRLSVAVNNSIMLKLYGLLMTDVLYNVFQDDKISILKQIYDKERFNKAKDLAYTVIKLRKLSVVENKEKIAVLLIELRETIRDASFTLDAAQITHGIKEIFDEALKL